MNKDKIQNHIEVIEESNKWVKANLQGNKANESYRNLVNLRRSLKKKYNALNCNTAAAIYGESQVGKSYLVSSLLSEVGKPFSIFDSLGNAHNFIQFINPPGGGSESTSLVTRFSVSYTPPYLEFPIKAVLLTPADVILLLCDSFFNDINRKGSETHLFTTDEINQKLVDYSQKFVNQANCQLYLSEDDILDIGEYFIKYFQTADRIIDSKFFSEVSQFIEKVQPSQWKDIFAILWNENQTITEIFSILIDSLQNLSFSKNLYLPIESALYANGTLLDVKRLHEICEAPNNIEPNYTPETILFLPESKQTLSFPKSYLCALTAELIFSQSDSLVNTKPFLRNTDLLDFPGARARMAIPLDSVEKKNIPDLLLRGKVAYLFNKYSDSEQISILIFCAKHTQAGQRIIPQLLNSWINNLIGDTVEKREKFIQQCEVAPLFIVGTFFNENLAYNPIQDNPKVSSIPLNNRWYQRFDKTLRDELIEHKNYTWFENWTQSCSYFQNIYLLRDFEKSETPSNIFRGYRANGMELDEIKPTDYPEFRTDLRQSFLNYDFVKRHFALPEDSWDKAASINQDGTDLIIEKLGFIADKISSPRQEKIHNELREFLSQTQLELNKHFHSNDKDDELRKAKEVSGSIKLQLDTAFASSRISLFGPLMKDFMLEESVVLDLFRKTLDDPSFRDNSSYDKYSTYRIRVPVRIDDTMDTYLERLFTEYDITTEDTKRDFLQKMEEAGVNIYEIVNGSTENSFQSNAQRLADVLLDFWYEHVGLDNREYIQKILVVDSNSLDDIRNMFRKLFKKIELSKKIASNIRPYMDSNQKSGISFEIIADIATELLNTCIHSVGFDYLEASDLEELKQANLKNNLGLVFDVNNSSVNLSVDELFNRIEHWSEILKSNPTELQFLPNYRQYFDWTNKLKLGFVSVCDIPTYDVDANLRLEAIINKSKNIEY